MSPSQIANSRASMSAQPAFILPRGLIFFAAIWLVASWILTLGVRAPVQPSSASYTPSVRLMLLCMASGIMIAWPLLRLSQSKAIYPIRQTLLDLLVLLGLAQVVIWPLRLFTTWTPARTAAIDATVAGWALLAGAVVAAAVATDRNGPRILAMLACLGMCLIGPAAAWLGVVSGVNAMELIGLGPLMAMRTLGEGGGSKPSLAQWQWIALLGVADLAAWASLGISTAVAVFSDRASRRRALNANAIAGEAAMDRPNASAAHPD